MEARAVNQNRNAQWADPEERLFGLTLDLGQEARLTPAFRSSRGTRNRKFSREPDLSSLSLVFYSRVPFLVFSLSLFLSLLVHVDLAAG